VLAAFVETVRARPPKPSLPVSQPQAAMIRALLLGKGDRPDAGLRGYDCARSEALRFQASCLGERYDDYRQLVLFNFSKRSWGYEPAARKPR
jgi:hypothetical protein